MNGVPLAELMFAYPAAVHVRRHGPRGYAVDEYGRYKPWLRDDFAFRCVYCLWRERWEKDGAAIFSIDHVTAQSVAPERICDYENLVYACTACNSSKRASSVPDPCAECFAALLRIRDDGTVEGLTPTGQRMVLILDLNGGRRPEYRGRLLDALRSIQQNAAKGPPEQIERQLRAWFGYPDDLPDLAPLRPPEGNTRPGGIHQSHFRRRQRGELPAIY
jgi:hypothetical protein